MKFAAIRGRGAAVVDPGQGRVWPLDDGLADMIDLIGRWDEVKQTIGPKGDGLAQADVRLEAPIPRPPRNVFCVGKNYHDHAHQFARSGFDTSAETAASAIPEAPIVFTKAPECVISDGEDVYYPVGLSEQVDYEAELAVVIGRGGRAIAADRALDHGWGYTIVNDITARDLQATADEIDPAGFTIQCWVNGELWQNARTALRPEWGLVSIHPASFGPEMKSRSPSLASGASRTVSLRQGRKTKIR